MNDERRPVAGRTPRRESPWTPSTSVAPPSAVEQSAIRKVAIRLVPFVALMFFINYLDRTAIGFAAPNGMNASLGLSAAQFGFASGVFFIGYILLEVPSNMALHRFGARRWLARIMVTWGIVAVLFTWVAVVRPAEHPAVPARRRRGRLLPRRDPVPEPVGAVAVPQPDPRPVLPRAAADHRDRRTAGRLADQPRRHVLRPRRLAVDVPRRRPAGDRRRCRGLVLPRRQPGQGQVADPGREGVADLGARGRARRQDRSGAKHPSIRSAFTNGRVWVLGLIYFGFIYGLYTLAFFLPTIIAGFQTAVRGRSSTTSTRA